MFFDIERFVLYVDFHDCSYQTHDTVDQNLFFETVKPPKSNDFRIRIIPRTPRIPKIPKIQEPKGQAKAISLKGGSDRFPATCWPLSAHRGAINLGRRTTARSSDRRSHVHGSQSAIHEGWAKFMGHQGRADPATAVPSSSLARLFPFI